MSLFSSVILPKLEKELISHAPEISKIVVDQIKNLALDIIEWAEKKIMDHSSAANEEEK